MTVLLVGVAHLVAGAPAPGRAVRAFSVARNLGRALSEVEAFHGVWSAAVVLFGLHLVLVGCLARRAGFVPRLLAALVCLLPDPLVARLTPSAGLDATTIASFFEPGPTAARASPVPSHPPSRRDDSA